MSHTFIYTTLSTKIFFIDPLEQFAVVPLLSHGLYTNYCPTFKTNIMLAWILNLTLVYFLTFLIVAPFNSNSRYSVLTVIIRKLYGLVKSVVTSNVSSQGYWCFNALLFLFLTILVSNLVGLLPYSFTVTGSFVVTFWFALSYFLAVTLIGIIKKEWNFAANFLPEGVPLAVAPLLAPIELVSYIARVFSLSIRLFANMMSGHALLKILLGFAWTMAGSGAVGIVAGFIPWGITTAFIFLEVLVAFVQAYVFVILLAIYINDVTSTH